MSQEKDIQRFATIGDALKEIQIPEPFLPIVEVTRSISDRSALYIEFLAGAFLQETGLKASEAELVVSYGLDQVVFSFRKKQK